MNRAQIDKCVDYLIEEIEKNHSCDIEKSIRRTSNFLVSQDLIEKVKAAILSKGGYEADGKNQSHLTNYYVRKTTPKEVNSRPMNILGKGDEPTNFDLEFNERNILIHALSHFPTTWDYATRYFPNINESGKMDYIQSVLAESGFFEYKDGSIQKTFKLTPAAHKSVFEKGAEKTVEEFLAIKNKPSPSFTFSQTFNSGGDIIGSGNQDFSFRGMDIKESFNKNEESQETKELAKEQIKDMPKNKWYRHWGFIVSVAALLLLLLLWLIDKLTKS